MKKFLRCLCVLLIAVLCIIMTSCGAETQPLCVCVDLAYVEEAAAGGINGCTPESAMGTFLLMLKNAGGPQDIEVEYVPASGAERETALARLRTEIMSGRGPDVFILNCDQKDFLNTEDALFPIAERTLHQALFLPLDEYMENNTQYAEWDRMNETVLAAGRTEEGQQIIPLSYTIPVSVYLQEEASHTPSKEITWQDMLEAEDMALAAAAVWTDNTGSLTDGCPFFKQRNVMLEFILGELADYEAEELLFTEEELKQRYTEIMALAQRYQQGDFDAAPEHYNDYLGFNFNWEGTLNSADGGVYQMQGSITRNSTVTLVPLYSDDGGVTAAITAYAAINRNTTRPEDAYYVLDYLLSNGVQKSVGLYNFFLSNPNSIPLHNDMMSTEYPVNGPTRWTLSDENFSALCAVREQITHVRFQGGLDNDLQKMCAECNHAKDEEDLMEIIAENYRIMLQKVRE